MELVRQVGAVGRDTRELQETVRCNYHDWGDDDAGDAYGHGETEGLQQISNCLVRVEKAEERELKAQLLVKDLKAIQAENKSLAKKFAQSNKT